MFGRELIIMKQCGASHQVLKEVDLLLHAELRHAYVCIYGTVSNSISSITIKISKTPGFLLLASEIQLL